MRHLLSTGMCLVFLCAAVPAHAQVDWHVQGGPRLWLNGGDTLIFATAGADVSLARGVFVGVDTMIHPEVFGLMGQVGYQTPRPLQRGPQVYVAVSAGVGFDDSSREGIGSIGGGFRFWLAPRIAPFADVRAFFVNDPDWSGFAQQLSFGLTVRLGRDEC